MCLFDQLNTVVGGPQNCALIIDLVQKSVTKWGTSLLGYCIEDLLQGWRGRWQDHHLHGRDQDQARDCVAHTRFISFNFSILTTSSGQPDSWSLTPLQSLPQAGARSFQWGGRRCVPSLPWTWTAPPLLAPPTSPCLLPQRYHEEAHMSLLWHLSFFVHIQKCGLKIENWCLIC